MVGDSDDTDVRDILTQAALLLEDGVLKGGAFDRLDYESIWLLGLKKMSGISPLHRRHSKEA